jgi:GTP 3',8-cyclase
MPTHTASSLPSRGPVPGPNYAYWGGSNLYVNLTSRCSSACGFCIRNFSHEVFGYDLHLRRDQEPDSTEVLEAVERACAQRVPDEVVFTGLGEPTLRLDVLLQSLTGIARVGLRTRLDTNGQGQLINPGKDVVADLRAAGLSAVSVSLNAHDEATYVALCQPGPVGAYEAVLEFIRRCVEAGIETTASVVDLPEVHVDEAAAVAARLGARFRVRSLVTSDTTQP